MVTGLARNEQQEDALTPALSQGAREACFPPNESEHQANPLPVETEAGFPSGKDDHQANPSPTEAESSFPPGEGDHQASPSSIKYDSSFPRPLGEGQGEGQGHGLPPALLARIRQLRKNSTPAEHLLWQLLRDRQLLGKKFRRQHPLAGYILDFYCHEAGLVIELDGGHHAEPDQATYDRERTQTLQSLGLRELRFRNRQVLDHTEAVLQVIIEALNL